MKQITIFYNKCEHTSRLLTGFHMLEEAKKAKLTLIENTDNFRGMSFQSLQAELDNTLVSFDLGDRWCLAHEEGCKYLNTVDAYFARSYSSNPEMRKASSNTNMHKVRPFGFDYYATYAGNPMDAARSKNPSKILKSIIGYNKCMYVPYFEGVADEKSKDFKILFMTRLWNPQDINPNEKGISDEVAEYRRYMMEEWAYINETRIQIVRQLRKRFGKAFYGGIYESPYSVEVCPDIVLDKSRVRKKAYLDRMKSSDICIGSMGLHQSIGWKTGEYIASARAIIAEQFAYEVPGNFDDGNHYIPFKTVRECVEAVESLYSNPEKIYAMKKANEQYYKEYLKPDQQIINAFSEIGIRL